MHIAIFLFGFGFVLLVVADVIGAGWRRKASAAAPVFHEREPQP
jgi:hypothetical protein